MERAGIAPQCPIPMTVSFPVDVGWRARTILGTLCHLCKQSPTGNPAGDWAAASRPARQAVSCKDGV